MEYKRKEPRAAWLFWWIICAWVYGWPWIVLHGIPRIVVGIIWLAAALLVTVLIAGARSDNTNRDEP